MEFSMTTMEQTRVPSMIGHVKRALAAAALGESELDPDVLQMPGMSGRHYRIFINALIGRLVPDARYLEVGAHAGSTLCAAISGNVVRAVTIDNWSQFGGPREAFLENLRRFRGQADVQLIESDFRFVDYEAIGPFNVFLFDGPHRDVDQYDGLRLALPAMDRVHVTIVDDWNREHIRRGTLRAFAELPVDVLYKVEIRTTLDGTHPAVHGAQSEWHNGYMIAVVEKQ
jgi:hypothetical protein